MANATKETKTVSRTELQVGNIVHFYGARFEIVSTRMIDHNTAGAITEATKEQDKVMVAIGKWLDGAIENGYFGPNKDWNFQGNNLSTAEIEI